MPNQLASTKKRKTVAEHAAVLAMLEHVAKASGITSTDLIRDAARDVIRRRAVETDLAIDLYQLWQDHTPQPPKAPQSPTRLARYKQALRAHDTLALELGLLDPSQVQAKNSLHKSHQRPALIGQL